MAIVGMFLGGSPGALIPAGQALLTLQWACQNPQDVGGASFSVTGQGFQRTIQADAGGRAEVMVPAPGSYSVSVTHEGAYMGDEPQKAVVESQRAYVVMFNGVVDQTVLFDQKIADMEARLMGNIDTRFSSLGTASHKDWVETVAEGGTGLPTEGAVYTHVQNEYARKFAKVSLDKGLLLTSHTESWFSYQLYKLLITTENITPGVTAEVYKSRDGSNYEYSMTADSEMLRSGAINISPQDTGFIMYTQRRDSSGSPSGQLYNDYIYLQLRLNTGTTVSVDLRTITKVR